MALELELATYKENLPELLADEGKFVLIHENDVVGMFSAYEDVIREGYEKFRADAISGKAGSSSGARSICYAPCRAMPHLTIQNNPLGPIVDITIGVSLPRAAVLTQKQRPIPPQVGIRALLDTGASGSWVDFAVLRRLDLSPTGMTSIITPSTGSAPQECATYDVSFALLHDVTSLRIGTLPVMESHLQMHGIQALIGRDILEMCLLIYNGTAGFFTLAY